MPVDSGHMQLMRKEITKRGIKDVTDAHFENFYELCEGNLKMTINAITSVCKGEIYEPLRVKLEAKRAAHQGWQLRVF